MHRSKLGGVGFLLFFVSAYGKKEGPYPPPFLNREKDKHIFFPNPPPSVKALLLALIIRHIRGGTQWGLVFFGQKKGGGWPYLPADI